MQTLIFCSTTNNTLSPMCQDNSLPLCDMPHKPYFQMVLEKLYGLTTPYDTLFKMGVGVTGDDIVNKVEEMTKCSLEV